MGVASSYTGQAAYYADGAQEAAAVAQEAAGGAIQTEADHSDMPSALVLCGPSGLESNC
jgi:hypothetical protein